MSHNLAAEEPAGGIDLLEGVEFDVAKRGSADRHGTCLRMEQAHGHGSGAGRNAE
jgi:hypothetical protein